MNKYVHGYNEREAERLADQADTLTDLLHRDTIYQENSLVLEAGCGTGAQTITLIRNSPGARFFSIDVSIQSLREAFMRFPDRAGVNVVFFQADIDYLPFRNGTFDHIFLCFVLEHLRDPLAKLSRLKDALKQGGTITVIEGDHGSVFFSPDSKDAKKAINCQIELQSEAGGDASIGRKIYPLLCGSGYDEVQVSPRVVYVDGSNPGLIEGFTRKTFIAMIEGVKEKALAENLIDEVTWKKGINDLYRTCEPDGTFIYMFFKGTAIKSI